MSAAAAQRVCSPPIPSPGQLHPDGRPGRRGEGCGGVRADPHHVVGVKEIAGPARRSKRYRRLVRGRLRSLVGSPSVPCCFHPCSNGNKHHCSETRIRLGEPPNTWHPSSVVVNLECSFRALATAPWHSGPEDKERRSRLTHADTCSFWQQLRAQSHRSGAYCVPGVLPQFSLLLSAGL